MVSPQPALVLFDIDGTLIRRAGPAHRQVLEDAVRRVTGRRSTTDGIPVQGMLDSDILRLMLRASGATAREMRDSMDAIMASAQRLYARRCPDLRAKVCPGVRGCLRRLIRRGATLGLVSGNLSRIAWTKLRRADLVEHFRFGAFAGDAPTRAALARRAAAEARRRGWIERGSPVALVGDHPNDVAAAKANGFLSVGVGTGIVSWEELIAAGPDVAVPDLRSLKVERLLCA
jgi:phosphoglycolate phosphatase